MYGYDGNMNAEQWLTLTGDPMSLTEEDRQRLGLGCNANADQAPSSTVKPIQRVHPVDD